MRENQWKTGDWCMIRGRSDGPYMVIVTAGKSLECKRLDGSHFTCPAALPYRVSAPKEQEKSEGNA